MNDKENVHPIEFYSTKKKSEIIPGKMDGTGDYHVKWYKQSHKDKYHIFFSDLWNLGGKKENENKRRTTQNLEKKGEKGEGDKKE
jgi:hypothetical protein